MELKLIKKQSKNTYTSKKGEERHYYNYFLMLENGCRIQIKASFPMKDNDRLDAIAIYEK